MKCIYVVTAHNPITKKEITQAFDSEQNAQQFSIGLHNARVMMYPYKKTLDLVNRLISRSIYETKL
jgi:hypothetical protein